MKLCSLENLHVNAIEDNRPVTSTDLNLELPWIFIPHEKPRMLKQAKYFISYLPYLDKNRDNSQGGNLGGGKCIKYFGGLIGCRSATARNHIGDLLFENLLLSLKKLKP